MVGVREVVEECCKLVGQKEVNGWLEKTAQKNYTFLKKTNANEKEKKINSI